MTFYQAMQLGANNLKPLIQNTKDKKLKQKYLTAFIIKNILCLVFCILMVTVFNKVFGSENSIVGVVTVIALLTFRLSYLDYNAKHSAFAILGIFCIFTVGPYLASMSTPILSFVINFISIMAIVVLACYNVNLSNQSIFVLGYLLLYGNPVSNVGVYTNRVIALLVGGVIVAGIFYIKQRKTEFKSTFTDVIKGFNFSNERTKWQLKLALGVCSGMLIGELINLPKVMWIGFACMSILQPNEEKIDFRVKTRFPYIIVGGIVYFVICLFIPAESRSLVGMLGGLLVGFCATYQWQTVFNCFGALSSAVPVLGLGGAIILRILNNGIGAIYSKVFNYIFDKVDEKIMAKHKAKKINNELKVN